MHNNYITFQHLSRWVLRFCTNDLLLYARAQSIWDVVYKLENNSKRGKHNSLICTHYKITPESDYIWDVSMLDSFILLPPSPSLSCTFQFLFHLKSPTYISFKAPFLSVGHGLGKKFFLVASRMWKAKFEVNLSQRTNELS